ncbi:MAG: hypothetical protein SPJ21_04535 [Prevotella sp.]|nr:hypothetical protein [Prevotella sp.]
MKKFILALTALLVMTVSASAMSYEQARQQALFLTDKMAYELNLTDAQYEAAYEINLDYLMGVRTVDDLYGTYWERRRLDFSYILLSWQYRAFCDAAYFFRPLYWDAGYWHFGIYARYPHRDYFFFGRPTFYVEYRGGHAWHMNGGRSWYRSRHYRPAVRHDNRYHGMRDGFSRGDFGNGYRGNPNSATSFGAARRPPVMGGSSFGNGNSKGNSFGSGKRPAIGGARTSNGNSFGNVNRESSTRSTETKGGSSFGGHRSGSVTSVPRNTFSPSTSTGGSSSNESTGSSFGHRPSSSSNSTFGGSRRSSSFGSNSGSSSFGNSSGSSSFGGSRRSSSFGSGKSSSPSTSSGSSSFGGSRRSSSSFGGSRSSGSSFGSSRSGGSSFGSSRSGGNSNRGGGSSFGGHR